MPELLAIQSTYFNDSVTFENLFKTNYDGLCNYAFKLLLNADEAEDAVQQVFARIWEKREQLIANSSVKSYLYRSTYNQCINEMKRKQKFNLLDDENHITAMDTADAATSTHIAEIEQSIKEGLANLPEKCRAIFVMSRYEELKYKDIANTLGISIKTVENQMGKALKIMRLHLTEFISLVISLIILK